MGIRREPWRSTASHGKSLRNRNKKCRIIYECGISFLHSEFHNKPLLSVNGQVLTVNCVCIFRVQQL